MAKWCGDEISGGEKIEHLNKVFSNTRVKAPSSIDTGLRFEFETLVFQKCESKPWRDLPSEVAEYQISDGESVLYVWIYNNVSSSLADVFCPRYIKGDTSELLGLERLRHTMRRLS